MEKFHKKTIMKSVKNFAISGFCVLTFIANAVAQTPVMMNLRTEAARALTVQRLSARSEMLKQEALALAVEHGWPVRGVTPEGVVFELVKVVDGRPLYYVTMNVNAAISTAADLVRNTSPYNLNGSGLIVGVWDGGSVRDTHQEFVSPARVELKNAAAYNNHATHVAGTIAAKGAAAAAEGMAPSVSVYSFDWNDDFAEMTDNAASGSGQTNKVQVSNHSYGYISGWANGDWSGTSGPHWFGVWPEREDRGFGRYDLLAADWDELCYNAPYFLPFKSAGNDRNDAAPSDGTTFYYLDGASWISKTYDSSTDPYSDGYKDGGFNTIGYNGVAKNIMTVGAVNDAVSGGTRDISAATMSSFSCWGPADDGRVKPDIVADGVALYSSIADSDSSYASYSGTSMSSPNAAGSALLLVEYYRSLFPGADMRAATLKGLVIHTADDLGNPGPDYIFGWGLMNTKAAADHIRDHAERTNAICIVESELTDADPVESYSFSWNGLDPIRVTLCWTDPPGPVQSGLNSTSPVLVNDLDLRVTGPGGLTNYLPYVLYPNNYTNSATTGDNILDNVEQVYIANPAAAGDYTIEVSHKGALTNGEQSFSLILSGQLSKEHADVTLHYLAQIYNGTARIVSATTDPSGLSVDITYDGNVFAPTNAGFYTVTGLVNDAVYQGGATGTLNVSKADQSISFSTPGNQTFTNEVTLSGSASSGLPLSFSASGPCELSGSTLTFTGTGVVSVTASQGGDGNWNPAPEVTNFFNVTKAFASVVLHALEQTYNGTARVVSATTDPSDLSVDITYDGNFFAPTNAGFYTVIGLVHENALYQGGATGVLEVYKANQTIDFPSPGNQMVTNVVTLNASASSGLPISFEAAGPCNLSGSTLTFTGTGAVSVTASQSGDGNWNAALSVVKSFSVSEETPPPRPAVFCDYTGDSRTDMAVYERLTGNWYIRSANEARRDGAFPPESDQPFTGSFTIQWGGPEFVPVPGDYNGDGLSDLAVYDRLSGTWHVRSVNESFSLVSQWGQPGQIPVPGDYDGDGISDLAVYNQVNGGWYVKTVSETIVLYGRQWGGPGLVPVPGDYNGNSRTDLAVYEQATGYWYISEVEEARSSKLEAQRSQPRADQPPAAKVKAQRDGAFPAESDQTSAFSLPIQWGGPGMAPVPGDFNGDGISDLAVYEQATGYWYIREVEEARSSKVKAQRSQPRADQTPAEKVKGERDIAFPLESDQTSAFSFLLQWGGPEFAPLIGDYDGDGVSDIAVYNVVSGDWYIRGVDEARRSQLEAQRSQPRADQSPAEKVNAQRDGAFQPESDQTSAGSFPIQWGGSGFMPVSDSAPASVPLGLIPVYRLYSSGAPDSTYAHLWTTNEQERDVMNSWPSWVYEGIAWYALSGESGDSIPMYRLYSPVTRQHLYTTDVDEYNALFESSAWSGEGVANYVWATSVSGRIPVYRFYHQAFKMHHFTSDPVEKNAIIEHPEWGYEYEGVAFYVYGDQ